MDVGAGHAGVHGDLPSGTRVAGYRVEERIGQGGMATVYRAWDERLRRQVALKVLSPALAADESFRNRFIRESWSAAAVDHPHIIPVFEAGQANGVLFLAMRYVPDGDVRTLLREEGQLSPVRASAIITSVAAALDAAHAAGLVHRDIKPGNMLLDRRPGQPDHVYLSDFGLTKSSASAGSLTRVGDFLGTVEYAAPEQIEGRDVDARTDEYALACAAYEMLCGEPPFRRDRAELVLYAHLNASARPLSARRPGLPPEADGVLARGLAKQPGYRYQSCGEFAAALAAALGVPQHSPAGSPGPARWDPRDLSPQADAWQARDAFVPPVPPAPPSAMGAQAPPGGPSPGIAADDAPGQPGPGWQPGPGQPAPGQPVPGQPGPGERSRTGLLAAALAGVAVLIVAGTITVIVLHGHASAGAGGQPSVKATSRGTASQPAVRTSTTITSPAGPSPTAPRSSPAVVGSSATASLYSVVRALPDPGSGGQQIDSVTFSGNGGTLLVGDMDGDSCAWAVSSGHLDSQFRGSGAKVFTSAISPDGTLGVTGDSTGGAYLWQPSTGRLITSLSDPGGQAANWAAFSPDGARLAIGDKDGDAYVWDVSGQSATLAATLPDPAGAGVWAVAFSPGGSTLATTDFKGNVYLWNLADPTAGPAQSFSIPGGQPVTAVAFTPDGKTLAAGNESGVTYLWPMAGGSPAVIGVPGAVWGLAVSQGYVLAIGDGDGKAYLYSLPSGHAIATLPDPAHGSQGVGAVAFSPDGKTLAAGDTNGTTYLWRVG